MVVTFNYEKETSLLFGTIYRPVADILLQNIRTGQWQPVTMLVDSGADYTLLPFWFSVPLGIELARDCEKGSTLGVGGKVKVYLYRNLIAKVGNWERKIPVGFLEREKVPPLLGRQGFLDRFTVVLSRRRVYFSEQQPKFNKHGDEK
jgi:hypothetical protein